MRHRSFIFKNGVLPKVIRSLKRFAVVVFSVGALGLMGCSAHFGVQPTTGATVTQGNFEVVGSVEGTATHTKILGFGSAGNMLERARLDAVDEANLEDSSRAIINWTSDYEYTFYGLTLEKKVILSGDVIRYTD